MKGHIGAKHPVDRATKTRNVLSGIQVIKLKTIIEYIILKRKCSQPTVIELRGILRRLDQKYRSKMGQSLTGLSSTHEINALAIIEGLYKRKNVRPIGEGLTTEELRLIGLVLES